MTLMDSVENTVDNTVDQLGIAPLVLRTTGASPTGHNGRRSLPVYAWGNDARDKTCSDQAVTRAIHNPQHLLSTTTDLQNLDCLEMSPL